MNNVSNSLVIIPTYNEKENIAQMVNKVLSLTPAYHLLVIDDGSPDGTGNIVEEMKNTLYNDSLHLIRRAGKQGLGTAYIAGFKWALERGYDFIFEMDADFSHDPNDLLRLRQAALDGADLVIGSRYKSGVNVVNWPIGRVLMSYFASKYVQLVTGMKVHDTTAGFKCYRREVLKSMNLDRIKFKGYAFQIEMKFTVWKLGYNVVEIPIIFTDRQEGISKMSGGIFNEAFWGVIRMKCRSLFINYKKK